MGLVSHSPSSSIRHSNVYSAPSSVREYCSNPFFSSRAIVDFELPTGPCSKMIRFSVPYPFAADFNTPTNRISGSSNPKIAS